MKLIIEPGIVHVVFHSFLLAGVLLKDRVDDVTLHVTQQTLRGGARLIQRVVWVQQTLLAGRSNVTKELWEQKCSNEYSQHIGRQKRECLLIAWKEIIVYVELGEDILGHSVEVQSLLPYAQRSFPPGHITTLNVNLGSTPGAKTQNFFPSSLCHWPFNMKELSHHTIRDFLQHIK